MKNLRDSLLLYAVTDRRGLGEKTLVQAVEEALRGGATMIQLREKDVSPEQFIAEALALRPPDVWQPILENIITAGIPGVLRLVLSGLWRKQRKEERYPDILIQEESNR